MELQRIFKITTHAGAALVLAAGLSACTSTSKAPSAPASGPTQASPSFASSTLCASNSYFQKYRCSFTRVEQAARSGDPDAQYALGYLYYYGIGTSQDRQTGLAWIDKAAAQGQPMAQQALQRLGVSPSTAKNSSSTGSVDSLSSSDSPTSSSDSASSDTAKSNSNNSPTQPTRPLSDYLPNYGEKRIDATTTPPSVDLSTSPVSSDQ